MHARRVHHGSLLLRYICARGIGVFPLDPAGAVAETLNLISSTTGNRLTSSVSDPAVLPSKRKHDSELGPGDSSTGMILRPVKGGGLIVFRDIGKPPDGAIRQNVFDAMQGNYMPALRELRNEVREGKMARKKTGKFPGLRQGGSSIGKLARELKMYNESQAMIQQHKMEQAEAVRRWRTQVSHYNFANICRPQDYSSHISATRMGLAMIYV